MSRTNANVFDEAVRVTEGEVPARIHLIGVRVNLSRLLPAQTQTQQPMKAFSFIRIITQASI